MTTIIVIPTYNEAENIAAITAELFTLEVDEDLQILIVDDDSPDGTGQITDELAQNCYPGRLHVLHRRGKLGLGTAYVTGFKWALEHNADYIIQMDADFSHSPTYIPQMLEKMAGHEVVVGSRYVSGGELDERWGWGRWLLSWFANSVWTRGILGVQTKDATAGFKCWQASALRQIGLDRITSNGYVFQIEMAFVSEKLNFRILEIPIYFEDRRIGQSKMSWPVKIEAALRVFEIRWRHRNVEPMPLSPSAQI
ncbi:MAG: polyprenol monophosphomannose synthase [Anaerolineae bacterium]|nr:polyprenol monophosphomannose synthase [Anaerolineae bacterium]